ncbi:hypothetical protein HK102_003236 [Quaeritorhiza haematococci]|nr:hypothetical protein HK102_003236 [Quaeritorhiza haematococci]
MSIAVVQGASRGIGLSFVKVLLERTPFHIVATARNPSAAQSNLEAALKSTTLPASNVSSRVTFLPLDLTDETTIAKAAEEVSKLGKISSSSKPVRLLINSSGYLNPEKSIRQLTKDGFLRHLEVNTLGALLVTKHFHGLLAPPSSATPAAPQPAKGFANTVVANLSARTGSIGDNKLGGWYSYRISKAALNQATKTLAVELGNRQVVVVSLHPGTVDTDLSRAYVKGVPAEKIFSPDQSASKLFAVMEGLTMKDNGSFLDYAAKPIVW